MAKIFKISGYIVTDNEYYDEESMENFLFKRCFLEQIE